MGIEAVGYLERKPEAELSREAKADSNPSPR